MQETARRRSNKERTAATRGRLIAVARDLFVAKGYGETATPEIVAAAGMTRGALYHNFSGKRALFRAVVEAELAAVAAEIERAAPAALGAVDALVAGGDAFVEAMRAEGRTRLLLLDGPAVLGRAEMDRIDMAFGGMGSLRTGLSDAMRAGAIAVLPLDAMTALLSSAFDRAAMAIEDGAPREDYRKAWTALVLGLRTPLRERPASP